MSASVRKWASTAERAGRAFAVAFVGVYVMSGLSVKAFTSASLLEKAADAGLAALGSLVLSLVGGNVGNSGTPSLLPASLDPAVPLAAQYAQANEALTFAAPLVLSPARHWPPDDRHLGLSGPRGQWPIDLPQETVFGRLPDPDAPPADDPAPAGFGASAQP